MFKSIITAFFGLSLLFVLPACTAQKANKTAKEMQSIKDKVNIDPIFQLETPRHDFGTIKLGEKPAYTFVFTNTSSEDLVIELVSGCHCTKIEAPQGKVFKPGEKGEIKIVYDSELEEGLGEHNKTIDILLEQEDPQTGYQIIKEAKFKVIIEE